MTRADLKNTLLQGSFANTQGNMPWSAFRANIFEIGSRRAKRVYFNARRP